MLGMSEMFALRLLAMLLAAGNNRGTTANSLYLLSNLI